MNHNIREVIATAQIHGGTRVIELVTFEVRDAYASQWHAQLNAYDSQHPHEQRNMAGYPVDYPSDLDRVREGAAQLLRPSQPGESCACWANWDPYCGQPECWGVYTASNAA